MEAMAGWKGASKSAAIAIAVGKILFRLNEKIDGSRLFFMGLDGSWFLMTSLEWI
jgi:hypothetical protein